MLENSLQVCKHMLLKEKHHNKREVALGGSQQDLSENQWNMKGASILEKMLNKS